MSVDQISVGEALAQSGRKAKECLRTYWPEGSIPVDPVRIADRLGIKVMKAELPDTVSGAISKEPGKDPIIVVQHSESEARQRLTIAHELGHYMHRLGSEKIDYVDLRGPLASSGTSPEEVYANNFAASLLMPAEAFKTAWNESKSPLELSKRFYVSVDAIAVRMKVLNLKTEQS